MINTFNRSRGMRILNLTQHKATPEQREAGVFEPKPETKNEIQKLLTFHELPSAVEIQKRVTQLVRIATTECIWKSTPYVMLGGAPFLMGPLEEKLRDKTLNPVYAFSKRESEEQVQQDGGTRKVAVFRHLGFVESFAR